MRWPWFRRSRPTDEAIDAAREAVRGREDAKASHVKAAHAADALRATVSANGFAEAVRAAMRRTG